MVAPMSDEKKWAIVTGGSRGLGFETAKGLIAAGISVYIIGKDEVRAQQSAEKLGCNFRAVDVADSKKFRQVLTEINEEATSNGFQTLDILVLAHGVMSEKMSKTLRTTAPRSAQEGADTAIWLATREFDPAKDKTGLLWEDRQVVDW